MIDEMPRGGKRPGAGRKPKPAAEKLSEAYLLRHLKAEMRAWDKKASSLKLPLSEWMRQTLDAAAGFKPPGRRPELPAMD